MIGSFVLNLLDEVVVHNVFGEGIITGQVDNYITVSFAKSEKKFIFPDSFEVFLKAKDKGISDKIQTYLASIQAEKQKIDQEKEKQSILSRQATENHISLYSSKRAKSYPRANIAFKCNFCDGGRSDKQIGFNGVCGDAVIRNNIEIEKRTWCCSDESACKQYLNREITRKGLDDRCKGDGFVCYESQMLRDWKALAGIVQTGENKGKPMKLNQVQSNSLCILTTRDPASTEEERYIFAVFLVDETYEGDGRDEGYVTTKSEFKLKLAPVEAKKLLFWNYHANGNKPEIAAWSSGLHRYFSNEEAVQILGDILMLKKGTKDENLAKELYNQFCKINGINPVLIPKAKGALKTGVVRSSLM